MDKNPINPASENELTPHLDTSVRMRKNVADPTKDNTEDKKDVLLGTTKQMLEKSMKKRFKKKKPLRFMQTRDISFYFARETYLKSFIREMLIFIGFVITVIVLSHSTTSSVQYYYTKVITGLFIKTQFIVGAGDRLTFMDISLMDSIWPFIEKVLLQNFYWRHWYNSNTTKTELTHDDSNILYENKLIGLPRMRQVRVRHDSCTILHEFINMFGTCYAEYSLSVEDQEPYGLRNSSAWVYSDEETMGSSSYVGRLTTYGGGGYYMDFNLTKDISNFTVHTLKSNLWIDRATRLIIIEFTIYNANINYFCFVQLAFELLPSGGVLPSYDIDILRFAAHLNFMDYLKLVFQSIFIAFIVFYLIEEGYELYYFRLAYFKSYWNWLDIVLLGLSCATIVLYIYLYIFSKSELNKIIKIEDEHVVFQKPVFVNKLYRDLLYILLLLSFFKLLKYISFNQSMEQMQTAIAKATKDILCYSVIFVTVFIAFAHLGHLLFGTKVNDFRTLVRSIFALIRTIVGDFNYHAIEHADPFFGPLYFFSFIFFIFFILVNMFLAIIVDSYSTVHSETIASGTQLQVSDLVGRGLNHLLRKLGCKKLAATRQLQAEQEFARNTYHDIRALLHKCGFTELEINLFFEKFDISESKLVSSDEIRHLLSNLEMMPVSEVQETEGGGHPDLDKELEELIQRVELMEDAIHTADVKIDIILIKVDEMQEKRMGPRRNTT